MPSELLADVALRATIPGVEPVFTYRVPPRLQAAVRPGQLVWAPLRRQRVQGIVLDLYRRQEGGWLLETGAQDGYGASPLDHRRADESRPAFDAPTLRDLLDVADREAAITPAQVRLARWISEHYRAPLYEALALMLPPGVSQEAAATWQATPGGMIVDLGALPERERAVLYFLRQRGETTERDLRAALRGADSELRETYAALQERGLVHRGAELTRPRARPRTERMVRLLLEPAQLEAAIDELGRAPKQRAVLEFLQTHGYVQDEGEPQNHRTAERQNREPQNREPQNREPQNREPRTANRELQNHGTTELHTQNVTFKTQHSALAYPSTALLQETDADLATLRALERKEVLELTTREVRRDPLAGDNVPPDIPPPLTTAQEAAWRPIAAALDETGDSRLGSGKTESASNLQPPVSAFLLHGITGSGKTEIYLRAIGRAMRRGKQALVLVPEIALTAQLVRRFAARFPGKLAVLHSGLSLGERYDEWRRLRHGDAMLAIGSRSAAFAPLPNLGLIIVDEEHEASYKHDGPPRYHARDAALKLAELTNSTIVLGSATPSLESYHAAREGDMTLIALSERVGMTHDKDGLPHSIALPLPPVRIVDMRVELQKGNRSIFSRALQFALAAALDRDEQAILFLNRRGAAAFIMCRDCGHVISCPNCSSPLVVHYDEEARDGRLEARRVEANSSLPPPASSLLVCHSCNHRELVPLHCPECWSPRIKSFGVGTQRVVEEVEALFPSARAMRWDRDSVGRKGAHERLLDLFLRHEADVLVGTQMIAKGLDLPLVSVVGVVAADTGLHLPDFRAGERTFQLLTQVAGRAGRRSAGAQVILQTYAPEHYALLAAQEHDYAGFYSQEIAFRRQTGYPPFSRLVRFVYSAGTDERAARAAHALADEIQQLATKIGLEDWGLIGPAPAFFHRQRNRYRWHLLLRAADPQPLLETLGSPPGWVLDVDPVHVL